MTRKIFWKKPISSLLDASSGEKGLKRVLGSGGLLLMGIGAIIGAGIFILTGIASANYSGPALVISFMNRCYNWSPIIYGIFTEKMGYFPVTITFTLSKSSSLQINSH